MRSLFGVQHKENNLKFEHTFQLCVLVKLVAILLLKDKCTFYLFQCNGQVRLCQRAGKTDPQTRFSRPRSCLNSIVPALPQHFQMFIVRHFPGEHLHSLRQRHLHTPWPFSLKTHEFLKPKTFRAYQKYVCSDDLIRRLCVIFLQALK